MARTVGPAVGGLVITAFGVAACFFCNAASFLILLVGLILMNASEIHRASGVVKQAMWTGLREGIGFVYRTKDVRTAIFSVAVVSSFGMIYQTLNPLYAQDIFFVDANSYGLMLSVLGIGSVCAGLTIAFFGKKLTTILISVSMFGIGIMEVLLALTTSYVVALGILFFLGYCVTSSATNANALVQTNCPDTLQGRVMSVYTMMFNGARPIGSFYAGIVAQFLGPQPAMGIGAVVVFGGAFYVLMSGLQSRAHKVAQSGS
jgi:predicted MFS family arabinose efflux permease